MFVKKGPLEYQMVIKTYLCTYLRDRSYSSDSRDSSDRSESSDSSDSNDTSDRSDQTTLYTKKFNLFFSTKKHLYTKITQPLHT